MSKKILFFGNERLATGVTTTAPALRALLANNYDVAAVVVAQKTTGPSRKPRPLEIVEIAEAHSIPVIAPVSLKDSAEELASYGAEAAVLIAYGKIIPQAVLDIFPGGIANIHPSLLPRHRGPTPLESVILSGEPETGVSLMRLSLQMDAGPVYAQQAVKLTGHENKQDLADKLGVIGSELVIQNLPAIIDGSLDPQPQDESQVTTDSQIVNTDGLIDWTKSAEQLEREIRAYHGWPRSRAKLGGTEVIITKAYTASGSGAPGQVDTQNKQLAVYCSQDKLIIKSLIPAGKKEMSAEAFLAGYKL